MAALGDHDLRAAVAIIDDGRADDPGPGLPWAVLDGLIALIPCDEVGFSELDVGRELQPLLQAVEDGDVRDVAVAEDYVRADVDAFWQLYPSFRTLGFPEGVGELVRLSDHVTRGELQDNPLWAEFFRPDGVQHHLHVNLPARPGYTRRLLFWRHSARDFSDRDMLVLQLLWPHLYDIFRDSRRRQLGIPRLTPREWQVLDLAAQGHSNAEIARMQFTSISTVRKHMENIMERTGTHSRGAAAARMMPWADVNRGALAPYGEADLVSAQARQRSGRRLGPSDTP